MIKFFRKIRQKLLQENKFSKYLAYALGEILLVVIGILIAVQINAWNEAVKLAEAEKKILEELLVDLRADSVDNAINLEYYEDARFSSEVIIDALENNLPWNDSMKVHFARLYSHGIATFSTSAFENLKSRGLDLISNDSIRRKLTFLYTAMHENINKGEKEFASDNLNQVVLPVLTSRLKMNSWWDAVPYDYEGLKDDIVFTETVRFKGNAMWFLRNNTRTAYKRVNNLIQAIEKELAVLSN